MDWAGDVGRVATYALAASTAAEVCGAGATSGSAAGPDMLLRSPPVQDGLPRLSILVRTACQNVVGEEIVSSGGLGPSEVLAV